ncbi:molybdopterin molybdotransferase MoeA [Rhodovulum sp. DZ06]|uniref:molybdopterin molybdotransferase MoeA n=1 Tax=Rhodovulum sp. DZ06 TaxID=3425126 RepID=UPI003D33481C
MHDGGCCDRESGGGAAHLPLEAARRRAAGIAAPIGRIETVPPGDAAGRVLAAPAHASLAQPGFDRSAMDGYALRSADLTGAGPWRLPVALRAAAGDAPAALPKRAAARIFTGAPLPAGADAVVMQEGTRREGAVVELSAAPRSGDNVRRRAEEFEAGDPLIPAGRRLSARDLALAASGGVRSLSVRARVRVALLVTGNELAIAGAAPDPGSIPDVDTPLLPPQRVPDRLEDHLRAIGEAARGADLVITTGGVSVGEEDHVRAAVLGLGGRIEVEGVAMKPGKPTALGRIGDAVWLGAPGNPMSACIAFCLFVPSLLAGLSGDAGAPPPRFGVAANALRKQAGRAEIRPARLKGAGAAGAPRLVIDAHVSSDRLGPLARAQCCVILPAGAEEIAPGAPVEILPFPEGM